MMKRFISIVIILTMLCAFEVACAVSVELSGDELSISAGLLKDNTEADLSLKAFHLLGKNADGSYLVHDGENMYSVGASELRDVLASLDADIPAIGTLETLSRGMKSDDVIPLQECLRTLGFLAGKADGDFGPGTLAAVQAFQAENGLAETGEADEITQLLAASLTADPVVITYHKDPLAQFAPIMGYSNVDLDPVVNSGLSMNYDDIKGEGFISNGRTYTVDASGNTDLDKYELTVRFGLLTREVDENKLDIVPVLRISCLCVRQPVMDAVTLKAGDLRAENTVENLSTRLEGVYTFEEALVPLTDKMVDTLAGAGEAEDLKLRVEGQYRSFDISIDDPASAALVGQVAQAIRKQS